MVSRLQELTTLHSNMFLLILVLAKIREELVLKDFTFQYVSINTIRSTSA